VGVLLLFPGLSACFSAGNSLAANRRPGFSQGLPSLMPYEFVRCLVHSDDVLGGADGLNALSRGQDIPSAFPKKSQVLDDFGAGIFDRAEGESTLIVDTAVENDPIPRTPYSILSDPCPCTVTGLG